MSDEEKTPSADPITTRKGIGQRMKMANVELMKHADLIMPTASIPIPTQ